MPKIISFVNHKGGVGKTTTTLNLGQALAKFHNKNVLLIDLDPQANLSSSLGFDTDDNEVETIYDALNGKANLPINKVSDNLHIVLSSLDLSASEMELSSVISRETLLKRLLEPIKNKYDYIMIDCSPSIGLLTINALTASTGTIIVLQSEFLALKGMQKLLQTVDNIKKYTNTSLSFYGVLLTQFDERLNLSKEVEQTMINHFEDKLFKTKIRKNIALAEAPSTGQSIFEYNPLSNGAIDYKKLANELIQLK